MKITLDLTTEEAVAIHQSSLQLSSSVRDALETAVHTEQQGLADIHQLTGMKDRARTFGERHRLSKLIEAKGGPKSSICKCGTSITPANEGFPIGECDDCYAKGYGK